MLECSLSFLLVSANRGFFWSLNLGEIGETQQGLKSFHGQIPVTVTNLHKHVDRSFIPKCVLVQGCDLKENLQANLRTRNKPNKLSRQGKDRPKSSSISFNLFFTTHFLCTYLYLKRDFLNHLLNPGIDKLPL